MIELPMIATDRTGSKMPDLRAESHDTALRKLSQDFEKAFLSEMLRHSGLAQMPEDFNGGPGEARFSGFLIESYAEKLAQSGQIGLAERIYQDLTAKETA